MGMYTELVLAVSLEELPEYHERVLKWFGEPLNPLELKSEHPFFKCERWDTLGRYGLYHRHYNFQKDKYSDFHCLDIRCELKNYDDEIEKFLDWISPYLIDGFCGYMRHETREEPTLIYSSKRKIVFINSINLEKCDRYDEFNEVCGCHECVEKMSRRSH